MRYLGAALLAAGAALAGRWWVARLRGREECLEGLVLMLNRMQTELEYSAPPLEGLLECLCATELGAASSLVRVCRERLAVCGDFPSAWREAVKRTAPRLNAEDRASLLAFGQGLGTTDLNGQRRGLALYLRLFDEARTRARSEREKYGAYLPRLSLLLGLCGAVLLL